MVRQTNLQRPLVTAFIFAALVIGLLISTPARSQVTGATLSGTVVDASGGAIADAQISILNTATGTVRTSATDSAGFYSVPNLLPGPYEISVTATGFATPTRMGATLAVGAQQVLNFTLQVGQSSQTVEVNGEPPSVELASSTIGGLVDSKTIEELPLNGRDWTQLGALQPGVNIVLTQVAAGLGVASGHRNNRGNGAQMTISGTRPQLNNYRLDGVSIADFTGGSPGSTNGVTLGVDAIAEFSVLTANYSAEYGRTAGGVVNAITRSGANQFHGTAFWFLRDKHLDARNFFDAAELPPFHRNQFGASSGGAIQKDKTFFFADYEGLRQTLGTTHVFNVPSPDARNGILHNADGTTTVVMVDPQVAPYLAFYPLPNGPLNGTGNTGQLILASTGNAVEDFVTTRLDRKFSEKDSLFGTWSYDKAHNQAPDAFTTVLIGNLSSRQSVAIEETHVFNPALVNSARVGFNRVTSTDVLGLKAFNPLAEDVSLGSFPGKTAPQIQVPGLTQFNGGIGATGGFPRVWNSYQFYDDAFLTKGAHSFKFGFAFERMQLNVGVLPSIPNGRFAFGSLQNFLTNQPKTFQGGPPGGSSTNQIRQSLFGGYLQDDWRLRPNLTLNLGLRYEMVTVPEDTQGKLANLQPFTAAAPQLGSPYFKNPTLRNFEPRVGFAWDPFRNGKTSVRGAFGIFDALPLNNTVQELESDTAPFRFLITAGNLDPGSFPTEAASIANIVPENLQYTSVEFRPHRNYVMIWNLNVERQLTPSATLTVGYVGNHGVHMADRADDVNMVLPTTTPDGRLLWPSPAGSGTKLNPAVGGIRAVYWDGDAEYDALLVGLTKRMSHGFQVQVSYTWGKNIDEGSSNVASDEYTNSISSLLWFCKRCRRGLSDFNIAHTFVANYLWDVPTPRNWGGITSHVLGGWELAGIVTAEGGVPFTPLMGGDPLGLNSSDAFAYPDRVAGPGCDHPVNPGQPNNYIKLQCFAAPNPLTLFGNAGRNTITGPGLVDVDFSLIKNTRISRISETFNVQFRAEFFNILNRANFAPPLSNSTLFDETGAPVSGAGVINATSTSSRQVQLGLKLIW